MACENCGAAALERLCVYCAGLRARTRPTLLTFDEWREHMSAAAARAVELLDADKAAAAEQKPGLQALAHMLAAASIIEACPALPSFEWYASMIPRGAQGFGRRGPSS